MARIIDPRVEEARAAQMENTIRGMSVTATSRTVQRRLHKCVTKPNGDAIHTSTAVAVAGPKFFE